ncbi:hypothetical protein EYF80_068222 [Liparis tanakae]|uniref:Uncharacterized protein n=1 Tax=Liparis tanakae TaxID=230148 RepID=A0A4Z2DYR9_9TELE|nr:hypothetical protein EYF80_068222 [Liparis tanakae]
MELRRRAAVESERETRSDRDQRSRSTGTESVR